MMTDMTAKLFLGILSISDKTFRNRIKEINEMIEKYGATIISKKHYGYLLEIKNHQLFDKLIEESNEINFPNTIDERKKFIKQAAEKWGISDRRVRVLCSEGKIPGAYQEGRVWKIPYDVTKPTDGRYKITESLIPILEEKLDNLKASLLID